MKSLFNSLALFVLLSQVSHAQYQLSGYITDATTGEALIGASVYVIETKTGVSSNQFGFYSLSTKSTDTLVVRISFVGYQAKTDTFSQTGQYHWDVALTPGISLKAVEVVAHEEQAQLAGNTAAKNISLQAIKDIPRLAGEADLMKGLHLLPGIARGDDGNANLFVRGGSPDQNLILLDGVPVYNANHLFGFLSVFNPDALQQVQFYKGGIPARFDGRLSSVLDISMKEGNVKKLSGVVALNPVVGKLHLEVPLKKDRSSLMISGRRSWLGDIIFGNNENYNLYDLNVKTHTRIGEKDRVFASIYLGKDRYYDQYENSDFNYNWGNKTGSIRWEHIFSPRWFGQFQAYWANFRFTQDNSGIYNNIEYLDQTRSGVDEIGVQGQWEFVANPNLTFRTGLKGSYFRFAPESNRVRGQNIDTLLQADPIITAEKLGVFTELEWKLGKLTLHPGMRVSHYQVETSAYTDVQPRLRLHWRNTSNTAFNFSFDRMVQHIHLLTNSSLGLPTDLWLSSTAQTAPQYGWQIATGYFQKLGKGFQLSTEAYYKKMNNLIEYAEGVGYLFNNTQSWEEKVVYGKGESYGIEWLLEKNGGRISGWLGYTLSRAWRQFPDIDNGERFPFKYDRRHDISLFLKYKLDTRRFLSLTYAYSTGNALTVPVGSYRGSTAPIWESFDYNFLDNYEELPYIEGQNAFRMPSYHRLDLNYEDTKQKKNRRRVWTFSIYNAYNRLNPFILYLHQGELKQHALFPIIPSLGYRVEF